MTRLSRGAFRSTRIDISRLGPLSTLGLFCALALAGVDCATYTGSGDPGASGGDAAATSGGSGGRFIAGGAGSGSAGFQNQQAGASPTSAGTSGNPGAAGSAGKGGAASAGSGGTTGNAGNGGKTGTGGSSSGNGGSAGNGGGPSAGGAAGKGGGGGSTGGGSTSGGSTSGGSTSGGSTSGGSTSGGSTSGGGTAGNGGSAGAGIVDRLLSQGKPASANSEQTTTPHPAADGNDASITTRWCAADNLVGHSWQVDLGVLSTLATLQVMWEKPVVYKFKVEGSPDNAVWSMLLDKTSSSNAAQTQMYPLATAPIARYVRVTVTGLPDTNTWASFFDFAVYGH